MQNNNNELDKSLNNFFNELNIDSHLRIEKDYGDGYVCLQRNEAERRQAAHDIRSSEDCIIELLRNSRDAHAKNIFVATSKENNIRQIIVIDDGDGIPEHLHTTVFEPRVTSKLNSVHTDKWGVHGRGMALYSIKENVIEAAICSSRPHCGTAISVHSNTAVLPEKKDQSTFPSFDIKEDNNVLVRGPHNILRCCVEFALEHKQGLNIFYGSPAEIAASLWEYASTNINADDRVFGSVDASTPLTHILAYHSNPDDFQQACNSLGLKISTRTARRILDKSIEPVQSIASLVGFCLSNKTTQPQNNNRENSDASHKTNTIRKTGGNKFNRFNASNIVLNSKDIQLLKHTASKTYKQIAPSYYLNPNVDVTVKTTSTNIVISVPIVEEE